MYFCKYMCEIKVTLVTILIPFFFFFLGIPFTHTSEHVKMMTVHFLLIPFKQEELKISLENQSWTHDKGELLDHKLEPIRL